MLTCQPPADAPWCEIKPSHASYKYLDVKTLPPSRKRERFVMGETVKGRWEPCHLLHVAAVVAAVKSMDVHDLCAAVEKNTVEMFFRC